MAHNTKATFAGSSDSLGLGQLLFESRDCGFQLMDLVNEAVLHLEEGKTIDSNEFSSHTLPESDLILFLTKGDNQV